MTIEKAADALLADINEMFETGTVTVGMSRTGPKSNQIEELYIYVLNRNAAKLFKDTYDQKDYCGYRVNVRYTGQFKPC